MRETLDGHPDNLAHAYAELRSRTNIGRWVFSRRALLGLTQKDVAELARTKQGRVSEVETLDGNVTFDTLDRITMALGLELTCQLRAKEVRSGDATTSQILNTAIYVESRRVAGIETTVTAESDAGPNARLAHA